MLDLLPGLLLVAGGTGACFVTAATTAMAHVEHEHAGLTSALLNTGHEFGASLGVAFVSALAATGLADGSVAGPATVTGFGNAFLGCAVVAAAVGIAAAWLLPAGRPPVDAPTFVH